MSAAAKPDTHIAASASLLYRTCSMHTWIELFISSRRVGRAAPALFSQKAAVRMEFLTGTQHAVMAHLIFPPPIFGNSSSEFAIMGLFPFFPPFLYCSESITTFY
jgi:hypothetical protein